MAGFKVPRTIYKLVFEGEEYEGLVVRARAMTIGEQEQWHALKWNSESADFFSSYLVDWNLTDDDGRPIPADRDGISDLEVAFMTKIVQAWTLAGIRVAAPLAKPSREGEPSEELGEIPMEISSTSLAS